MALIKISDGWWIDISQLSNFFIDKENNITKYQFANSNITFACTADEGETIEKLIQDYFKRINYQYQRGSNVGSDAKANSIVGIPGIANI